MKHLKKLGSIVLTACLALGLMGCGSSGSTAASANTDSAKSAASSGAELAQTIPDAMKGKKVLVAYYSWSGHTKAVAEQISSETGGTLFEIQPAVPYPTDYRECVDVAKKEMQDNARPAVAKAVDNMDQYDVIFVGYPIWWGKAPMHVYTFLESYSLSGKVIVPFCTSGGSPLSGSIPDLQKAVPGAQVVQGSQSTDPAKISQWLKDIHAVS